MTARIAMMPRIAVGLVCVAACAGPGAVEPDAAPDGVADGGDAPGAVADADLVTIPRFSTTTHLDVAQVERISRFRSSVGHDASDAFETCRSMKHYLCPTNCLGPNFPPPGSHDPAWTTIAVRSPVAGTITRVEPEQTFGTQLHVRPDGYPDFRVRIFHVTPGADVIEGATVVAGQLLGTHASDLTMSDVAVEWFIPGGVRAVSFFDTLTDAGFAALEARGVASRSALQISADERDADPLTCAGETFTTAGTLDSWVVLAP